MRLVLDTNVVASALLWGGVPHLLLQAAREKRVELFTSTPLLAELAVLVRPASVPRITPDPNDDVVIGTALTAKADGIVTGDQPFLTVAAYQGVRIIGVREAIRAITAA
jgi:hypothetical protein